MTQTVKCLPTLRETWVHTLSHEYLLEKEMAIHSSAIAWKTPWTEQPGRLQSMGLQKLDTTEQLHFTSLHCVLTKKCREVYHKSKNATLWRCCSCVTEKEKTCPN